MEEDMKKVLLNILILFLIWTIHVNHQNKTQQTELCLRIEKELLTLKQEAVEYGFARPVLSTESIEIEWILTDKRPVILLATMPERIK